MSLAARAGRRVPTATYRLQFHRGFGFRQARKITDYLSELGISDCYASPLFQARADSPHGYDVCDFGRFNPALGTDADFYRFTSALHERGMGLLLDLVPNHMGADPANAMWLDVLENGQASPYAHWFDIDWPAPGAEGKVVLPILGEDFAEALKAQKIQLAFKSAGFWFVYYDHQFPLAPHSYHRLLTKLIKRVRDRSPKDHREQGLESLAAAFKSGATDFTKLKRRFADCMRRDAQLREHLLALVNDINRKPGSFDTLETLLQEQHYRLVNWRTGAELINYRRFFDVAELVSLHMELPQVFEATHRLVVCLVREGHVTGLRIDHPDGLWAPKQYLDQLQYALQCSREPGAEAITGLQRQSRKRNAAFRRQQTSAQTSLPHECDLPSAMSDGQRFFVVVEKILSGDERLPGDWPVAGTTGYDFLTQVNNLFVGGQNEAAFDAIYRDFTGNEKDFAGAQYAGKKRVLLTSLVSELNALTRRLSRLSSRTHRLHCEALRAALVEIIACFPVYRTYVHETTRSPTDSERRFILEACCLAADRVSGRAAPALEILKKILLLEPTSYWEREDRNNLVEFIMKFQQLTGPVMAKGVEDTAFYNFNRLISLNEVGGDPGRFGQGTDRFHAYNRLQCEQWPDSLLATATHDTKRGEDARARINVLSEMPREWRECLGRWRGLNERHKSMVGGHLAPDGNDEYLFYQALLGAWAPEAETPEGIARLKNRLRGYMLKAARESKAHSSWVEPDRRYEDAMSRFVERVLDDRAEDGFVQEFSPFQHRVAFFGCFNSLSQTLLKMTAPGVPDFYQGAELWDLNLVDPDNRRAVDFDQRQRLLGNLKKRWLDGSGRGQVLADLLGNLPSGDIKLFLIWRTLQFRRRHPKVFAEGRYAALPVAGARKDHVVAFGRSIESTEIIVVVPRLMVGLTNGLERVPIGAEVWQDTYLDLSDLRPGRRYQNIFAEEQHALSKSQVWPLAKILSQFPVALLVRLKDENNPALKAARRRKAPRLITLRRS